MHKDELCKVLEASSPDDVSLLFGTNQLRSVQIILGVWCQSAHKCIGSP